MSTTRIPPPPWAGYIWSAGNTLFVEFPCPSGKQPHIAEYALTEGGLSKALKAIQALANRDLAPPTPGTYTIHETKVIPLRKSPLMTEAMTEAVKRVLRKHGVG